MVTGGASGIGRALCVEFAGAGARVIVADLEDTRAESTAAAIRAVGGEAIAVRVDVADPDSVDALAARAWAAFGGVHVLCNNAGVALWGPLAEATRRDWQWVLGVNLWGVIHGLGAFLPRMLAAGQGGHIVNTASMAGLVATAGLGVYNTSKYAVVGLSETLAKELRPHGIGVSVLCPMGVATDIRRSARNRPAGLVNPGDSAAVSSATSRAAEPVALLGPTLAPEVVARMVLAAIRENRVHVITHAEGREAMRRRAERLEAGIVETARDHQPGDLAGRQLGDRAGHGGTP